MKKEVKEMPLISVLIPVYNTEKYIKRCINSLRKQTYKNIEIVVVDDESTDDSLLKLEKMALRDERIKLYFKENEHNLAKTRNFLLNHISGKYFVFVDSDDYVEKNYVKDLYCNLIRNEADCAMCDFRFQICSMPMLKKWADKKYVLDRSDAISEMLLGKDMHFMLWNKIFKTKLVSSLTFDEDITYGEDLIFSLKYVQRCSKVSYFNKPLYHYSFRLGSEVHKTFSEKKLSFFNGLNQILLEETDSQINSAIKAWLCFSSCWFLYKNNKTQCLLQSDVEMLKKCIINYSPNLLENDKTRKAYKSAYKFLYKKNKIALRGE